MNCICCTDCTVSIVLIVLYQLYWLYYINCTDSTVSIVRNCTDCTVLIVLIVLYQLYWLYFILFTLGERIRPQIDVSYEYVEEGDALDLRCNVRVSFYILSPDLFFTSYFINGVYKSNWEYRIKIKVCIWYTGKTKILKYFFCLYTK